MAQYFGCPIYVLYANEEDGVLDVALMWQILV